MSNSHKAFTALLCTASLVSLDRSSTTTQEPAALIGFCGRYNPFQTAGIPACQRDVEQAEVYVVDAGHFALETDAEAKKIRELPHKKVGLK
jgi:hypothetical protein